MDQANNYYIKTNRIFHPIRKYSWIFTLLVAIGGLWEPKLGLLVLFVMAGLVTTSFFKGRFWCGNVCPHGSLYDRIILPFSRNKKIPKTLQSKIFVALFFSFFIFSFSNRVINAFHVWGTFDFYDKLGFVFVMTYLIVMIIGGSLALFVTPRTWCQFCPMGTMQKASHSMGKAVQVAKKAEKKVTLSNPNLCHSCGKCARVCPFQLQPYLEFSENHQFDNGNCIKCATCVENCPASILSLDTEKEALKLKEETSIQGYENRQKIKAKIAEINTLAEDVNEYVFHFVSPEKVDYHAGQFILVKIQDEPIQYRAYSIASYNEDSTKLSVIIKKVKNGYGTTKIFNEFHVGDIVELEGPMGDELVLDPEAEKVLFIANGIGITPFIALVQDSLVNRPHRKDVTLLAGQRYENELLYHSYFNQMVEQNHQFTYVPVVSRDKESKLPKGYVTDQLRNRDWTGYKVYMCGSKNMIKDSFDILLENGVKKEDIFYESEERIKL